MDLLLNVLGDAVDLNRLGHYNGTDRPQRPSIRSRTSLESCGIRKNW
jgi:hypothetical protein